MSRFVSGYRATRYQVCNFRRYTGSPNSDSICASDSNQKWQFNPTNARSFISIFGACALRKDTRPLLILN